MMKRSLGWFLMIGLMVLISSCARITRHSCYNKEIKPEKLPALTKVADQLEEWLDETGQKLVIAARRGQSLDAYGLQFSHAAFLKKEEEGWVVYHLLTQCPNDIGGLYRQDLEHFLEPATQNYRLGVVVPQPELQEKLAGLLSSDQERHEVFDARYNGVAYPFGLGSQNSNSWILEFFSKSLAHDGLHSREESIAWLQQDGYEPSLLEVGKIKQFFLNWIIPNVDKSEQPAEERRAGRLWINSGDSTLNYIARYGMEVTPCKPAGGKLSEKVCEFQASF